MAGSILILNRQCRFLLADTSPIIALTRPLHQSKRFAADLDAVLATSASYHIAPLIEVVPTPTDLELQDADALIFTSENAVNAVGINLSNRRAYCVGTRTAQAAQTKGCIVLNANGTAQDLIALIRAHQPKGRLIHLRGRHTRGDITATLLKHEISAKDVIVYEQLQKPFSPNTISMLRQTILVLFPVFSPRTAQILASELESIPLKAHFVCISDATSTPLQTLVGGSLSVASAPNGSSMVDAVAQAWRDIKSG